MKTKEGKYLCEFSDDEKYRYGWVAGWGKGKPVMFIGLNPSTADENQTDPTVAKCMEWAKAWGYSGIIMANVFAYRSTDPQALYSIADPVGTKNDYYLKKLSTFTSDIIACWGNHAELKQRGEAVEALIARPMLCLKQNKNGYPSHPLYLKKSIKPTLYVKS